MSILTMSVPAAGATITLVNIDPPSPTAGVVIVLNGASSSGKSSLARRVQALLDLPFLLISGDQLIEAGLLPARRDPQAPFDWLRQMRPRLFDGFHRDLAEIDRREMARGDRFPGEGRSHVEHDHIHDHGPYHLRIDTTAGATEASAHIVGEAWRKRPTRAKPSRTNQPLAASRSRPTAAPRLAHIERPP
jgi:chloramphenicol 3-O phosphotransferase